jgi:hypothetical protein
MFLLLEVVSLLLISYTFQYTLFKNDDDFISIHLNKKTFSFESTLNLQESSKQHTIQFDLQSSINIVYSDILDANTLKTIPKFPETNVILNHKNYYGYYTYISLNIPDSQISLQNIPTFLSTKGVYSFKNSLSLSFISNSNSISFLEYLTINKHIHYKTFSIINFPTVLQSAIYFGGIPNEISKTSTYFGKCSIISNSTNWGCKLDSITVLNNFTAHKTYTLFSKKTFNNTNNYNNIHNQIRDDNSLLAMFNPKDKYFSIPQFMFQKLKDEIFRDVFKNHDCSFGSDNIIFCSLYKASSILSEIRFKIEGDEYIIYGSDLFEYYDKMAEFLIIQNEDSNDLNVVLANGFIKRFNISFDYDNEEVTLYSKYSIVYPNYNKRSRSNVVKSIRLCKTNVIVLVCGSLLLLFIKVLEMRQHNKS